MSQEDISKTPPEEGKGEGAAKGELDALAASVRELSAELKDVGASAARSWKVTAWVFGILCVVIASYLGFIYSRLSDFMEPEFLIELAGTRAENAIYELRDKASEQIRGPLKTQVSNFIDDQIEKLPESLPQYRQKLADDLAGRADDLLADLEVRLATLNDDLPEMRRKIATFVTDKLPEVSTYIDKNIEDLRRRLVDEATKFRTKLATEADRLVDEEIGTRIDELMEQLPDLTDKAIAELKKRAPGQVDELKNLVIDKGIPHGSMLVKDLVEQRVEQVTEQVQEFIDQAVANIVAQHRDDFRKFVSGEFTGDQFALLMEGAFDEAAGEILDKYFKEAEKHLQTAQDNLSLLLQKKAQGTLAGRDELYYKSVVLWKSLAGRMAEAMRPQGGER